MPNDVNSSDNLNLIFAKGNQVNDKEQVEEVNNHNNFLHTEEEIEILDEAFEEELQDNVDDNTLIETTVKTKRKKRHHVDEKEWKCKKAKIMREQGKEYKGRKVVYGKVVGYVNRPKREFHEQVENDIENLIEIDELHTVIEDQDILEPDTTFDVSNQFSKRKRRKRHQVSEVDWQCKQAKILREQGKYYKGRKIL